MTKEEMTIKGLEIVTYAGEARSSYLKVIQLLEKKAFDEAMKTLNEGNESIKEAHKAQMDLLVAEANKDYSDVTITMVHGQDHLMTAILLRELIEMSLLKLYQKVDMLETEITNLKQNLNNSGKEEKGLFKKWKNT